MKLFYIIIDEYFDIQQNQFSSITQTFKWTYVACTYSYISKSLTNTILLGSNTMRERHSHSVDIFVYTKSKVWNESVRFLFFFFCQNDYYYLSNWIRRTLCGCMYYCCCCFAWQFVVLSFCAQFNVCCLAEGWNTTRAKKTEIVLTYTYSILHRKKSVLFVVQIYWAQSSTTMWNFWKKKKKLRSEQKRQKKHQRRRKTATATTTTTTKIKRKNRTESIIQVTKLSLYTLRLHDCIGALQRYSET